MSPDVHNLAAAYVLHALPPDEVPLFEAHLRACAACREEVVDLREAVVRLSSTVAAPPPRELKEQLMRAIGGVRPLPPLPVEDVASPGRRRGPFWIVGGLVAVLLAVLTVLVIEVIGAQHTLDRERAELALTQRVFTAGDAVRHELAGGDAVIVVSRAADAVVFLAPGLSPAPDGMVHQVWLTGSGGATSAGLVETGDDPDQVVATGVLAAQQLTVTLEPDGGSVQPSGEPILETGLSP